MARCDDVVWRILPGAGFLSRCWGDECVVYNTASNDTHLVDGVSEQALQILRKGPQTQAQLAEKLAVSLALDDDEELRAFLEVLLPEFNKLGLIEKAGP